MASLALVGAIDTALRVMGYWTVSKATCDVVLYDANIGTGSTVRVGGTSAHASALWMASLAGARSDQNSATAAGAALGGSRAGTF